VCLLSTTACDQADVDSDVPPTAWTGTVDGHANFVHDWEIVPYCEGPVQALLQPDGAMELTGTCSLLWGPFFGETFEVSGAGRVDGDDAVSLDLVFEYDTTERRFSDVTVIGAVSGETGEAIEAMGTNRYVSETGNGLDVEAFVVVRLRRED